MQENLNKRRIVLFVIFSILFIFSLLLYNSLYLKKDNNNVEYNKVKILNDYSRFFTVNSCVYKYISYLQNDNVDALLKVVNQDYIQNNAITSTNFNKYFEELDGSYTFSSNEIYYENINDDIIKYYVRGNIIKDTLDGFDRGSERYFIINFDTEKQVFDITPFDKLGYEEVING